MSESERHKFYLVVFGILLGLMVTLVIVDVFRGGDASQWVVWIAGLLGLGSAGLAAKNTTSE